MLQLRAVGAFRGVRSAVCQNAFLGPPISVTVFLHACCCVHALPAHLGPVLQLGVLSLSETRAPLQLLHGCLCCVKRVNFTASKGAQTGWLLALSVAACLQRGQCQCAFVHIVLFQGSTTGPKIRGCKGLRVPAAAAASEPFFCSPPERAGVTPPTLHCGCHMHSAAAQPPFITNHVSTAAYVTAMGSSPASIPALQSSALHTISSLAAQTPICNIATLSPT
jgi:hypothetical protein